MNTQPSRRPRTATSTVGTRHLVLEVRTDRSRAPSPVKDPGAGEPSAIVDLVNSARAGDRGSWNQLVDRFLPLVNAVVSRYRLPAADADDVNQIVWLRLVEHLDDLREPRALPGWIAAIARNESLQMIRLRGHDTPVDPQATTMTRASDLPELDDGLIRDERVSALHEAILELPPRRRDLLRLLMADPPLSYDQISAIVGIPVGSIGPTRARALEQLRNARAIRALRDDGKPGASN
jgi:RNA polymerase sigma factor (sigma-70 family)